MTSTSETYLKELLESMDRRLARMEGQLDTMHSGGCALGAANKAKVESLMKGNAAAGATAGAITSGVVTGIVFVAKALGISFANTGGQ